MNSIYFRTVEVTQWSFAHDILLESETRRPGSGWFFPYAVAAVAGVNVCLRKVVANDIFAAVKEHRVTHISGAPIVMSTMWLWRFDVKSMGNIPEIPKHEDNEGNLMIAARVWMILTYIINLIWVGCLWRWENCASKMYQNSNFNGKMMRTHWVRGRQTHLDVSKTLGFGWIFTLQPSFIREMITIGYRWYPIFVQTQLLTPWSFNMAGQVLIAMCVYQRVAPL